MFLILKCNSFTSLKFVLVGDSGYPLRTWLLTPLEQEPLDNTPESRYNNAHKRTRNIIERCNGVLKMRFRCLLKHRTLHYKPVTACKIINSCVVLHNMCIEYNVPIPDDEPDNIDFGIILHQNNLDVNIDVPLGRINPELAAGRRTRQRLINNLFRR